MNLFHTKESIFTRRDSFDHKGRDRCFYASFSLSLYQSLSLSLYIYIYIYIKVCMCVCVPGSSVGTATELWAGRSGIESLWGRDFPPVQTGPRAHPTSCKMGTGSFPGVKCGRGVLLPTHSLPVPRSWKSRTIPLPTLWATPGL